MFAYGADASIILMFPFRENSIRTIAFSIAFFLLNEVFGFVLSFFFFSLWGFLS